MYSDLDIEYFEAALDWVAARNEVCTENGVGLSGISQGGNIALAMAQFLGPKIGAVCVQGASYCGICPGVMKYKDQVIQSAFLTWMGQVKKICFCLHWFIISDERYTNWHRDPNKN